MSSLTRTKKKELYTKKVNSRSMKVDRPSKTHEATLPIKDERTIQKLVDHCRWLRDKASGSFNRYITYRNYIIVVLGLNTALRAEDLLQLKVKDITKGRIWVTELKTQKQQDFFLSAEVKREVDEYIHEFDLNDNEYLFQSRTRQNGEYDKPVTRKQIWRTMKVLGKYIGINYSFGLHSLRKTFGYQYIKHSKNQWNAFLNLQKMYNHSSIKTTQLYICWDRDDVEKSRENISIGIGQRGGTR